MARIHIVRFFFLCVVFRGLDMEYLFFSFEICFFSIKSTKLLIVKGLKGDTSDIDTYTVYGHTFFYSFRILYDVRYIFLISILEI